MIFMAILQVHGQKRWQCFDQPFSLTLSSLLTDEVVNIRPDTVWEWMDSEEIVCLGVEFVLKGWLAAEELLAAEEAWRPTHSDWV